MVSDDHAVVTQFPVGPPVFENWRASLRGDETLSAFEYPLFTDTRILGQGRDSYGPYQFLNPVKIGSDPFLRQPSVVVRVSQHLGFGPTPMEQTDIARYHGGEWTDELAALVSLLLGIRAMAGSITRIFEPSADPMGWPVAWYEHPELPTTFSGRRQVVPTIPEEVNLAGLDQMRLLPRLTSERAAALVRAARLYQDALWLVESEPSLSWLMFVSAAETAANQWHAERGTPLERLVAARPELVQILQDVGGAALAGEVARQIADSIGATKKFVDFIMAHLPAPPERRPVHWACIPWDDVGMRRTLRVVYRHRSTALHGGTPFPHPMSWPPRPIEAGDAPCERPLGSAAAARGGVWVADDIPIQLHMFEYIIRGALLTWWQRMVPEKSNEEPSARTGC